MPRSDAFYMQQALRLARRGLGKTSPNPAVGAVVVKNGAIVGRGYHRRAGLPHAEVEALRQAGKKALGATLYVTLEPCNHRGRTGPCCEAILSSRIKRVVAAVEDPNPMTRGRGLKRLKQAGLRLSVGVEGDAARALNAPFFKAMTQGLPFVRVKCAESLDGKIATATGQSRWISSPASRRLVHRWRSQADAVLVGINTVLADNPRLSARATAASRQPVKIILDSRLRLKPSARCLSRLSPAPTWVVTRSSLSSARARALRRRGAEILRAQHGPGGRIALRPLFKQLVRRGIQSILIEGGSEVAASAFAERLVDRAAFFIAPLILGGAEAPSAVGGKGVARLSQAVRLRNTAILLSGEDLCVEGQVVYPR